MRTHSKSYPFNSNTTIPRRLNRRRVPNIVESEIRTIEEVVPMADRTMEELLQAPTEGYGEAIVILEILTENFEIKTNLLQLVQANKFYGFERDNPHTHISNFKRMTVILKYRDVLNDVIKLMLFPYSLDGAARIWYEKEPPNSILTWDDLVNKFVNQFFPPSKTTHLKNEISRFTQRFEETFGEAWDRFKEMLRGCPHHGFLELTQIDTFDNGLTEQDQDSLNAAAGGNLLNKTTREALKIIENKSKVRYSRSKSNVSRVNTNSRDSVSKTDDRIDKLADQISNLVHIVNKQVITLATAKAVEKTCVTCGGAHAYYDCIASDSNQPSVCAAIGSYNQVSPPNRASHQIPPPCFTPVQNNPNRYNQNQGQGNYFSQANNFNQGNNFNKGNNFQNNQEIPNEFSNYMKSNEIMIKSMQNQINVLRGDFNKQEENLRRNLNNDMRSILGSFFQNQASTSGTLPSNIVPDPKGEMKVVTTRSGLAYEGPSIPTNSPLEKIVEQNTEETMDKEHSNCQGSTAQVQPPVVPISIPEPDVSRTQPKPTIPYPSRLNDQKLREKATNKMEKFFQIFHDLHFDISFADALLLKPKFASTIKSFLTNKDKLFELAKVPLNENCSAMLLKKLSEKLGDPSKFLIPCDFRGMDVCHALADLGASINLMPLSIWKKLSLPELTPTRMTLELADRSITRPKGVFEDVFVKVEKFHFPTDFVVVDFEADPRVPLILGRSFLRTGRALIDVYGEEITLRVNDESVTFNLNQTMRYSSTYDDNSMNRVDVIYIACEEFVQDVLDFQYNPKNSNPTLVSNPLISESNFCKEPIVKSSSPTLTPFGEKKLLNKDPFQLPPMDLKLAEETKAKSSVEEPPGLELKELFSHLEYAFLEDSKKLPVIIAKDLKDEDYKPAVQSQRRVNPKIHDLIKKEVIKLLDAGMIYPISDSPWVSPIHCVPKKGGMTVVANENNSNETCYRLERYFQIPLDPQDQEKTTFTCPYGTFAYRRMPFGLCNAPGMFQREGIVLGHNISKSGIEVDRAKVDVIAKLLHPTIVKGVRSFLGHAENVLMHLILKKKLTEASILVVPDWNLPFELMCDASDFAIGAVLGQRKTKHFQPIHYASKTMTEAQIHYTTTEKEMLAVVYAFEKFRPCLVLSKSIVNTDHSAKKYLLNKQDAKPRLENPHKDVLENKDINENFPLETLGSSSSDSTSWFADIANFHAGNFIKKGLTSQQKKKFFKDKLLISSKLATRDLQEAIMVPISQRRKGKEKSLKEMKCLKTLSKFVRYSMYGVESKAFPTNDARVVVKFLKSLFSRFSIPRAIIRDRGSHFCNDQFTRVMIKYGVTHRLATAYHPQTSGQVEVSNRGLKRILERTVEENRTSWSDKLDDALWAFRTAFKNPIGCTPYKLVYGKSCHLLIVLEDRAYWALKHVNFDLKTAGDHRKLQLNELNELRDQAYENSVIYKERTKKLHDSKIKNRIFNVSDQVLLFNSRLKIFLRKLKTCWSVPFTITDLFPYGNVELSQPNGPNFKVNGHRVKHYFGGDIPSKVVLDLHTFPMDN
uniref:Reverse transcriptase domain-containing protein n=1 Tax=Tanacetum cinerariifolium TaxID=118510 RepID=A0A699GWZ1_TANCI|nr:reverse transcriptase domain-containing protein [Tanacetum cinerariifolium]